jgi:GTP-binding protein YchF
VEFVDIAGLVKGASEGEGLGNKFLSNIREVDAIVEVVRIFEDDNIIHVHNKVDPVSDIEVINLELILADQESVSKRLSNLQKDTKAGKKEAIFEDEVLQKISKHLAEGKLIGTLPVNENEYAVIKQLNLLTAKPIMYALNKKAGGNNLDEKNDPRYAKLIDYMGVNKFHFVIIDAKIEDELKDLKGEEKEIFRAELGGKDDGIDSLIKAGYSLLNLITYFTTGEDETRAWTIRSGSTAPVAGMAIHTDFRDKFIRAEVVHCTDLLSSGSYSSAREKGLVRTEGKEYVVKDGDVIEFKI